MADEVRNSSRHAAPALAIAIVLVFVISATATWLVGGGFWSGGSSAALMSLRRMTNRSVWGLAPVTEELHTTSLPPVLFGSVAGGRKGSVGSGNSGTRSGDHGVMAAGRGSRNARATAVDCNRCQKGAAAAVGDDAFGNQYLAICAAVKDQHEDLQEWINYHRSIGVGKFHLYDAGSQPPMNETVSEHIGSGLIDYHYWNTTNASDKEPPPQIQIYRHCIAHYNSSHQFIAFIDADEFFVLKGDRFRSVPALLKHMMAFEPFGGLAVNWVVFGSSGHVHRPNSGVFQAYTKCLPRSSIHSEHVKSIVNTDYAIHPGKDPHHFIYKPGYYAVNERFQKVTGPLYPAEDIKYIALHHYVVKSLEEFSAKSARGNGMNTSKPFSFFTAMDEQSTENCTDAVGLGPFA